MMTTEEARISLKATHASYSNNVVPSNQYQISDHISDSKTGFDCTIYRKIGTNEFIVSFAGSQDGQDVAADVALGTEQWKSKRLSVLESLSKLHATNITFTGHSLGGAIAQYAAYDYLKENLENHANVKLCTFNGLGGMDGITQMHSNDVSSVQFDTIVRQIDAAHFFASSSGTSDMVARLGGGHLGGNTFEIKMATLKAGLVAIHQAWDDFANLTVPQYITRPDYLNIPKVQKLAALIAYLGTDGNMTDAEGWMRAAGGAFIAASLLSNAELNQLLSAFNPNKLLAGDYHVRDLSPVVRLGFLIAGAGALVGAEVIDFGADASKLATKAIEETILAYEQCVKLFQYTYEQAMESASDSVDVISDAFAEAFEFAATRIIDLAGHYTEAVDYTAGKWNDLQALGHQIVDWLNDQLLFFSNNSMEVVNTFLNLVASDAFGATLIRMLFSTAETVISPVILDLDGDGVETTGLKSGAFFDHDGNGFAEQTGWVKGDDGLLVFDKNGNGTIDGGQELFGNQTLLANGSRAANGFLALAELDGNADGLIDVNDAAYADLKIWQDADGDGYAAASELKTLSEMGIVSIHTGFTDSTLIDANGNAHKQVGAYEKADGSTGTATDVWFKADKMFTVAEERLDVPVNIAVLPDLRGSGNVYDLHQAMVRDTSGQLQSLVRQFIAAADPAVRSGLMDQIFFKWTGSDGISPTSRGPFFDARKLVTLEKILGENFVQDSNPAPGPGAVHPLNDAYKTLSESMYGQLMAQTHLKDLYAQITYSWDAAASCIRADLSGARTFIQNELKENYSSGKELLSEFIRTIRGLDADEKTNLAFFCEAFAGQSAELLKITEEAGRNVIHLGAGNDSIPESGLKDLIYGYAGDDNLPGGAGNDKIDGGEGIDTLNGGSGSDILEGGAGDDNLSGGAGKDILLGGPGNDYLLGNEGSDTYLFSWGHGTDRIVNQDGGDSGVDILELTGGVKRNDVEFIMAAGNELNVRIKNTGESVYVNNWFSSDNNYRLDRFKFSDGEILTAAQLEAQGYQVYGTAGDDYRAGSTSHDSMYGYGGKDIFIGAVGNDRLDGGMGDDELYGGAGNDILVGGTGNDYLLGNEGSDTYQFSRGDGTDRIVNQDGGDSGVDTLEFTGGVKRNDVEFIMTAGGELNIRIKNTGESVYVNNWFSSDVNYRLDRFKFSNGEILTTAQLEAQGYQIYGTANDDYRTGSTSHDRMYGYGGNDTLIGGAGRDRLEGGTGDDSLAGGAGNDVLIGGTGNDYLQGNEGSDTYQFLRGQGADRIMNHDGGDPGVDTLAFTSGVYWGGVEFIKTEGNELQARIKSTGDSIYINGWFSSDSSYRLDRFKFSDGKILTAAKLEAQGYRVYGSEGDDYRTGSTSHDKMYGYGGNDTLKGGAGNDTLDGGSGADVMYGNAGNDVYVVDNTGDYVSENANEGTDAVLSSITYTLGSHGENLTLTAGAAINGTGNSLDNLLTGNAAVNILNGGAGKDILDGRAGNDALNGETGSDLYLINRTGGVDTIGDYSTNVGDVDILRLTEGIGKRAPVLVKQNNDLYLFLDESNYVRIENQFQNKDYGVERLEVSGGYYMTRSDIEDIVDTMGDINNNPGMDAFEKYDAMLVDQVYASTLAQSWQL